MCCFCSRNFYSCAVFYHSQDKDMRLHSAVVLLYCSAALLLYRYAVCVVFVATTFTVALFFIIRRLKTCDYILLLYCTSALLLLSLFTPSRLFSRFTPSRFTLHAKKSPLPLFKKEGFFVHNCFNHPPFLKGE